MDRHWFYPCNYRRHAQCANTACRSHCAQVAADAHMQRIGSRANAALANPANDVRGASYGEGVKGEKCAGRAAVQPWPIAQALRTDAESVSQPPHSALSLRKPSRSRTGRWRHGFDRRARIRCEVKRRLSEESQNTPGSGNDGRDRPIRRRRPPK